MLLVVVAHPDDEALWFGGWLVELGRRDAPTCVLCLTNRDDPVRAAEFRDYCGRVGARPVMLDYPDGGHERFPVRPDDLDRALRAAGVDPAGVECAITHSPHGNERPHPQHLQAWHLVKRWCAQRALPIGFFSERQLEQVEHSPPRPISPRASLSLVRATYLPLLRACAAKVAAAARGRPLHAGLGRRLAITREVRGVRAMLALTIDTAEKRRTLEAYASQIDGLGEYEALSGSVEYAYLFDDRAADALGRVLA
jgi:LmbE family N-acetylglucosaminyl deacetylase